LKITDGDEARLPVESPGCAVHEGVVDVAIFTITGFGDVETESRLDPLKRAVVLDVDTVGVVDTAGLAGAVGVGYTALRADLARTPTFARVSKALSGTVADHPDANGSIIVARNAPLHGAGRLCRNRDGPTDVAESSTGGACVAGLFVRAGGQSETDIVALGEVGVFQQYAGFALETPIALAVVDSAEAGADRLFIALAADTRSEIRAAEAEVVAVSAGVTARAGFNDRTSTGAIGAPGVLATVLNVSELSVAFARCEALRIDAYIGAWCEGVALIERRLAATRRVAVFVAKLAITAFGFGIWQVDQTDRVTVLNAQTVRRAPGLTFFAAFCHVWAEADRIVVRVLNILPAIAWIGVRCHILTVGDVFRVDDLQIINFLGIFRHVLVTIEVEREVCAGCERAAEEEYRD
jgi:hypothetical protein